MRHVICFGNLLQGDDGLGIHVYERLRERVFGDMAPAGSRLFDGGITGLGALSFFEDCDHVLIIDALSYRGDEGAVHEFGLHEVSAPAEVFSAHQLDVNHLIHVLPILFEGRAAPAVTVLGAEIRPSTGAFSMALSPPLERARDHIVARAAAWAARS
jgi:hydrogenase maturation protease